MTILEISLIGVGLAMDCFAVSVSMGLARKLKLNEVIRMASLFGLFQGGMTLAGWWFGSTMKPVIESIDHWIAFGLLVFIGLKMIVESFEKDKRCDVSELGNTKFLLSLAIATSIDALMTGISFGFIQVHIVLTVLLIALITFALSFIGGRAGGQTTLISAHRAEFIGGLVLIGIGFKILFEHL